MNRHLSVLAAALFSIVLTLACGAIEADSSSSPVCEPAEEAACFFGKVFADCGAGEPSLWCADEHPGFCIWFSGCHPDSYSRARRCDSENCAGSFHSSWGRVPWTRTREMNVEVVIDPTVVPTDVSLNCHGDVPSMASSVCSAGVTLSTWRSFPPGFPAMTVVSIVPVSLGDGASLVFEVDFFVQPPRARACFVHGSDAFPTLSEPLCASGGLIEASSAPAFEEEGVSFRFDLRFETDGRAFRLEGKL